MNKKLLIGMGIGVSITALAVPIAYFAYKKYMNLGECNEEMYALITVDDEKKEM